MQLVFGPNQCSTATRARWPVLQRAWHACNCAKCSIRKPICKRNCKPSAKTDEYPYPYVGSQATLSLPVCTVRVDASTVHRVFLSEAMLILIFSCAANKIFSSEFDMRTRDTGDELVCVIVWCASTVVPNAVFSLLGEGQLRRTARNTRRSICNREHYFG